MKNQAILDAIDNNLKHNPGQAKEPEWIMEILQASDVYLTSSDQGAVTKGTGELAMKNFCTIYDYQFGLTRGFNKESISNDLVPSGLCGHELKVVAPFASIQPTLHQAFAQNTLIASVTLARLATAASKIAKAGTIEIYAVSQYLFQNLYITAVVSKDDLTCISFRYTDIQYKKYSLNPKTATGAGSSIVSYHNFADSAAGSE